MAKELEELTFESRYREQVSDNKDRKRIDKKIAKKIIESSKVLCTTCISAGSALLEGIVFRRVLIDEASQATEPAILVSLSHGCQKAVLVGKFHFISAVPCRYNIGRFVGKPRELCSECKRFLQCTQCIFWIFFGNLKRVVLRGIQQSSACGGGADFV